LLNQKQLQTLKLRHEVNRGEQLWRYDQVPLRLQRF
jgi:hypothetical protein